MMMMHSRRPLRFLRRRLGERERIDISCIQKQQRGKRERENTTGEIERVPLFCVRSVLNACKYTYMEKALLLSFCSLHRLTEEIFRVSFFDPFFPLFCFLSVFFSPVWQFFSLFSQQTTNSRRRKKKKKKTSNNHHPRCARE